MNTALPNPLDNKTALTGLIVAAFVSRNSVPASLLPELIASVHTALSRLGKVSPSESSEPKLSPAEIRKSIKPDALISFLDGRPYKTLKRHLNAHGLTPADYRMKYGLPADYPMVAASYSETRSALAKGMGLGRVTQSRAVAKTANTAAVKASPAPARQRGGSPRKTKAA